MGQPPNDPTQPAIDAEQWLHMYQQMLKIRLFEEQTNELYTLAATIASGLAQ